MSEPSTSELLRENQELKSKIKVLSLQVKELQKQLYGNRSDKRPGSEDPGQGTLEGIEEGAWNEPAPPAAPQARRPQRQGKKKGPKPLNPHLPRVSEVVADPDLGELICPVTGKLMRVGFVETIEVLSRVPARYHVRSISRNVYVSQAGEAPVYSPWPSDVLPRSRIDTGVIAHLLTGRFADHQPLYRQQRMFERWSAPISRQSMSDWIEAVGSWLMPLYRLIRQQLLAGGYVQIDETPIRCRDPDLKRGKTIQGYFWVMGRPGSDVFFVWAPSRRYGEVNRLLGEDFEGLMQSDGYSAYESYAGAHDQVVWVGCWAHARRAFFEAQEENPKGARVALRLIGRLYQLERQWDEQGINAIERSRLRNKHFARTLKWLHQLALVLQQRCLPRQLLGKVSGYLLNQWKPLTAHLRYGRTRLDNNLIEQAIRPSAIGKKNWLFIGHPDAGERSAVIYSLVVSCQRHGKDPQAYLADVLRRIPSMTNQDDLTSLLPANWKPV